MPIHPWSHDAAERHAQQKAVDSESWRDFETLASMGVKVHLAPGRLPVVVRSLLSKHSMVESTIGMFDLKQHVDVLDQCGISMDDISIHLIRICAENLVNEHELWMSKKFIPPGVAAQYGRTVLQLLHQMPSDIYQQLLAEEDIGPANTVTGLLLRMNDGVFHDPSRTEGPFGGFRRVAHHAHRCAGPSAGHQCTPQSKTRSTQIFCRISHNVAVFSISRRP